MLYDRFASGSEGTVLFSVCPLPFRIESKERYFVLILTNPALRICNDHHHYNLCLSQ